MWNITSELSKLKKKCSDRFVINIQQIRSNNNNPVKYILWYSPYSYSLKYIHNILHIIQKIYSLNNNKTQHNKQVLTTLRMFKEKEWTNQAVAKYFFYQ